MVSDLCSVVLESCSVLKKDSSVNFLNPDPREDSLFDENAGVATAVDRLLMYRAVPREEYCLPKRGRRRGTHPRVMSKEGSNWLSSADGMVEKVASDCWNRSRDQRRMAEMTQVLGLISVNLISVNEGNK